MNEAGHVLLSIAGVAATLAGFSGLMIAFRGRSAKRTIAQTIAVRVLMMTSMSAMFFAIVPVPLLFGGVREDILWTTALAVLGLHFLYFSTVVPIDLVRRSVRITPRFVGFVIAHGLVGIVMLIFALDGPGQLQPAAYMAGIVWLIALGAAQLLAQSFLILALPKAVRPSIPEGEQNES